MLLRIDLRYCWQRSFHTAAGLSRVQRVQSWLSPHSLSSFFIEGAACGSISAAIGCAVMRSSKLA